MKKSIFFILVLLYALNTTAQEVYDLLTDHQGYWFLYSERIEQGEDGDWIAKETFANDEMVDSIMFEENILNTVSTMNGFMQSESRWKLKNGNIIEISDEMGVVQMEIIEVTPSRLVLKYSEERGDLLMAKISTYCFPDIRLSEEEAANLNNRGVFEIDGPTVRLN